MEVDKLEKMKYSVMKYKELQKLAKKVGVKANLPKADLIKALLENSQETESVEEEALVPLEESKLDATFELVNESEQNAVNETFEKEAEVLNLTFEKEQDLTKDDQDSSLETLDNFKNNSRFVEFMEKEDDEVNFKVSSRRTRSLEKALSTSSPIVKKLDTRKSIGTNSNQRDYLSVKNKTPLRKTVKTPGSIQKKTSKTPGSIQKKAESQIPRFVKFAQKNKTGKIPDFAKMHEKNFKKMESLDTYIEKKKKLTDTITKQLDRAKALSMEHNSIVKQLKSKTPRNTDTTDSKFVPAVTSTAKMNLNFGAQIANPGFKFGSTVSTNKSAEPFKFSAKPVAAAPKVVPRQRQDVKSSTMSKAATKPLNSNKKARKSLVNPTPNKPLLNITNNSNKSINLTNKSMTGTPSKKFDLAASLAKPLGYKPHTGKLKPWEKKKKEVVVNKLESSTQEQTKQRQMEVIKGVRLNKRAELLMMRRKMSS